MKVFCIGLGKTGTTSIHTAFKILGFDSVRFPRELSELEKKDAGTDCLIAANFPLLDIRYPGSKFLMTVRDKADWEVSQKRWKEAKKFMTGRAAKVGDECDRWLYGVSNHRYYDPKLMPWAYDRQLAYARWYFQGRKDDYLEINVCAGEGWEKLCPFLGKRIPDKPFPFENKNR